MIPLTEALKKAKVDAHANLPLLDTKRLVVSGEAAVFAAINAGVLTRAQAYARYHISEIELRLCERAVYFAGIPACAPPA